MKVASLSLTLLVLTTEAMATTAARSPATPPSSGAATQQIVPRDTVRAGQDIELRKVQAMLSRQGPPPEKKSGSRR
ncbi:MAG TPA: hypothetical protein VFO10_03715 [Oligoflexus sp.]|uniref:hypothetical protein n=1 Tax=Oligoflexus sp. TaxID=1971216 RepID=UPI002D7F0FEB|nr:hypothetical protein [Oligoflexus sp.]HET9236326.1 hypothetical protein [Oligoflexus sp.]